MPYTEDTRKVFGVKSTEKKVEKETEDKIDKNVVEIKKRILEKLGRPQNFLKIEVKSVGPDKYRANVLFQNFKKGALVASITRPYSYYITVIKDDVTFNPCIN